MRSVVGLVTLTTALGTSFATDRSRLPGGYQGFGAATPGGTHQPAFRVTTLDDAGPASLREAVRSGRRHVVFDVAGDIVLGSPLVVTGAFVTIDGSTAPDPGITLRNHGMVLRGDRGAHDVIVRGLRIRDARNDGIQIAYGAYNIVVDHVSVRGSGDGNIDITKQARDVTVSWSILAEPRGSQKNMLIKYDASRVTLHHNLFVDARQRNPLVSTDDAGTPATDLTLDMRNNLIWNWGGGSGTRITSGPRVNIVHNYYGAARGDAADALIVCHDALPLAQVRNCPRAHRAPAYAHVAGNVLDGAARDVNLSGTMPMPYGAPRVETSAACHAARAVLAEAGARPLDAADRAHLARISLPDCRS